MSLPLRTFARRGTVIVASLATAALALTVSPASAADTGHIAGTVTVAAGDFLSADVEAQAYVYDATYDDWSYSGSVPVASDGTFDISGLAGGTYRVEFYEYTGNFVGEFYDDAATIDAAADVVVAPGEARTGINAELAVASHVTGQVTGSGGPAENIDVTAYTQVTYRGETYWSETSYGSTDDQGNYELDGLRAGTYRIGFYDYSGAFVPEFYDDAPDVESATDIILGGATTSGIDADLAVASHVTGQVTGTAGVPLDNVGVSVFAPITEDGYTSWDHVGYGTETNGSGNYDLGGLPAGTYRLRFYDYNGDYATEFFDDASSIETATDVVTSVGSPAVDKDAQLELAAHITGQITDADGPLTDALAVAYAQVVDGDETYWYAQGFGWTSDTGTYAIDGLRSDTYKVEFLTYENTHVGEFFDNVDSLEAATALALGAGDTAAGKNAELAKATPDTPPAPPVVVPPVLMPPVVAPPVVTPPVVTPPAPQVTHVDSSSKPKVQGKKKVGSTLKAKVASWIPAGASVKYQWLANGKAIKKATKAKLKVTKKLKGKKVSLKVTATSPGSLPATTVTKVGKIKG